MMPQASNRRTSSDCTPTGKGSVYGALLDLTLHNTYRTVRLNDGEIRKLNHSLKKIDRNQRASAHIQSCVIGRVHKTLEELKAYRTVLNDQFRVANFQSLRNSESLSAIRRDPEKLKRHNKEYKIYHSGFQLRTLKDDVAMVMREQDTARQKQLQKDELLEMLKRKNEVYMVPRNGSMTFIINDHKKMVHEKRKIKLNPLRRNGGSRPMQNITTLTGTSADSSGSSNFGDCSSLTSSAVSPFNTWTKIV